MPQTNRPLPAPGQESVWDYPRPPRLESVASRVIIRHGGLTLADTTAALRVLETSHPPTYYLPPTDLRQDLLLATKASSWCEFKGKAIYWDILLPDGHRTPNAAWSYPDPTPAFAALAGHLAFYASRIDEAWVGDDQVQPQQGDFYGGWITPTILGPFKGGPGTTGW